MRHTRRRAVLTLAGILTFGAVLAAPSHAADAGRDAMRSVASSFSRVRSFRATMLVPSGQQLKVDFAAPDRYRMHAPMGDVVIVGATTYMHVGGQWMQMSIPSTEQALRNLRRPAAAGTFLDRATITDLGPAALNGKPMHRWKIRGMANGTQFTSTMWVGNDRLPYRNDVVTSTGTLTILYSDYNAPIVIVAPA